jgi:tRNA uridine 5-carboxymethylaminomethyl modification enzyme
LDADAKYSVYLARQEHDIERHRSEESLVVPDTLDIDAISGLSTEMKLKLRKFRPATIGQAGRIEGVTPAALMLLAAHARRNRSAGAARKLTNRRPRFT